MPKDLKSKTNFSKKTASLPEIKNFSEEVKLPWYWIKNSSGKASASVTFAFVSFWVTTLLYVLSSIKSCGLVEFREFDSTAVGTYLIPILTLYFGRRWTETKMESEAKNQSSQDETHPEQP